MDDSTMADGKARCDGLLSVSSMSRSDPTNYFSEFGAVGWIIVRFYRHEPALVSRSRVRQKAIFDKSVKWSIREPSPPHHIEIFIGWSFFGLVKAYVLVLGSFLLFSSFGLVKPFLLLFRWTQRTKHDLQSHQKKQ